MKTLKIFTVIVFVLSAFSSAGSADAAVRVRGYFKPSTGRYVMPSYRTGPNSSRFDNYSIRGNYNPYSGKTGTVDPFRSYYRW